MPKHYHNDIEPSLRQYVPVHFLLAEFLDEENGEPEQVKERFDFLLAKTYQSTQYFTTPAPKHISRTIQHIEYCYGDDGE